MSGIPQNAHNENDISSIDKLLSGFEEWLRGQ